MFMVKPTIVWKPLDFFFDLPWQESSLFVKLVIVARLVFMFRQITNQVSTGHISYSYTQGNYLSMTSKPKQIIHEPPLQVLKFHRDILLQQHSHYFTGYLLYFSSCLLKNSSFRKAFRVLLFNMYNINPEFFFYSCLNLLLN